jgi:hypothetical protein
MIRSADSQVGQLRLLFDALFVTCNLLFIMFIVLVTVCSILVFVFIDIVITSCGVGGFVLLVVLFCPIVHCL